MEGGELFAKISERTHPFTEQGLILTFILEMTSLMKGFNFTLTFFEEVAKIMHQICAAVKHLHTMRIVHRGRIVIL